MSRRVPLLAMLAVLLGLLVAPATAAPEEGILLRGDRTAWVDLYVYVNDTIGAADVTMRTKGSFVGFFLSPAPADRDTVGALVMPRVGATGGDSASIVKLGDSWDVRAGRYRAFLITDGPAEVFIPIDGQGHRGWVPRGHAPLSVRNTDFDVAAGSGGRTHDVPVRVGTRSLVVAAGMATSASLTAVDQLSTCVRHGAACAGSRGYSARLPLGRVWSYGVTFAPATGPYAASFDVDRTLGSDAGSHVEGAVLVLPIGRQT